MFELYTFEDFFLISNKFFNGIVFLIASYMVYLGYYCYTTGNQRSGLNPTCLSI